MRGMFVTSCLDLGSQGLLCVLRSSAKFGCGINSYLNTVS